MAALTEEQSLIRDQARAWIGTHTPVNALRTLRDRGDDQAHDAERWQSMVDMGWTGILIPEAYGGSDLGYLTFGLVLEEMGRQLTASPLFASAYVGASAVLAAGSDAQKADVLPNIVDGSDVLTLALDETPRHNPRRIECSAVTDESGYRLNGLKTFVPEGAIATQIITVARTDGAPDDRDGLTLLLVPADAQGLERTPVRAMDSRGYVDVQFNDVHVDASAVLGDVGGGRAALDAVLDRACAGLGAEMLGTAAQAFDMTLEYLKTREQFGRVIGSFQALGHRAAELFSQMELARSCAEAALQAIDTQSDDVSELCALSKARVGEFLHEMSNQLIQIHGGIGMTDEFDAGLYLKRARVVETLFGNRAYHRDRYARLLGF